MKSNGFDLLRLTLATLVIFSHSWGLLGLADPLQAVVGLNLGEVAVCGFFVLSGYLISQAWVRAPGVGFFRNRLLRIAPAYVVAFLVCVVVVGAIATANPSAYLAAIQWPSELRLLLTLHSPAAYPRAFEGLPEPYLNGSMWTIKFEFLCYLLTPVFMFRRWGLYAFWAVSVVGALFVRQTGTNITAFPLFAACFLSGAIMAERKWKPPSLNLRGNWPDVSYGTYLYGWPVQNLLVWFGLASPLALFAVAVPLAWLLGLASCLLIERPALRLKSGTTAGWTSTDGQPATGFVSPTSRRDSPQPTDG